MAHGHDRHVGLNHKAQPAAADGKVIGRSRTNRKQWETLTFTRMIASSGCWTLTSEINLPPPRDLARFVTLLGERQFLDANVVRRGVKYNSLHRQSIEFLIQAEVDALKEVGLVYHVRC